MPYQFKLHAPDLLWVVMHGHMELEHAEAYYYDIWQTLDSCPHPTDLLVDGRGLHSATFAARRRTEQVAHHPHLGNIAFVVREHHLLLFAPLARLVSGIGLFGAEHEALIYLRSSRGQYSLSGAATVRQAEQAMGHTSNESVPRVAPPVPILPSHQPPASPSSLVPSTPQPVPPAVPSSLVLPTPQPGPPVPPVNPTPTQPAPAAPPAPTQPRSLSATRGLHRLTDLVNGWARNLEALSDSFD